MRRKIRHAPRKSRNIACCLLLSATKTIPERTMVNVVTAVRQQPCRPFFQYAAIERPHGEAAFFFHHDAFRHQAQTQSVVSTLLPKHRRPARVCFDVYRRDVTPAEASMPHVR